jgi:hypothetical protein
MAGEVWVHGNVRCPDCGYDSAEEGEAHVWVDGREKRLECPRCRSLRARGYHEPDPENIVEFDIGTEVEAISGWAVIDCLDKEGRRLDVYASFGTLDPQTVIGQAITLSDQLRAAYVDTDAEVTGVLDFGQDLKGPE